MRNKKIILFVIIAIILISLSCSLLERSNPLGVVEDISNDPSMLNTIPASTLTSTVTPESQNANLEATATPESQNANLEATATPELQNAPLEAVELGGLYTYFWVVYDPDIWRVGENEFGHTLISRDDPTCIVRENIGMGINWPDVTLQNYQEQIANYEVDITQYISSKGEIFLEIFYFNSENIFIAIDTGNDPEYCIVTARHVVEKSAENRFEPIQ